MDQLEVSMRGHNGSTNPFEEDFVPGSENVISVFQKAAMVNLHGSPGSASPAAVADLAGGPLTTALRQLSQAINPSPAVKKGMVYRPEYYVQHVDLGVPVKSLDHTKLPFKELVSGMGRVMQGHAALDGYWR